MMKNRKNTKEFNKDRGFALVTVIVVVAFLSILSTMILYTSSNNSYMKSTDAKIKENFYEAETGLEQFRALLLQMYTDSFNKAYEKTQTEYLFRANGDDRKSNFAHALFDDFETQWNAAAVDDTTLKAFMMTQMGTGYVDSFDFTGGVPTLTIDYTKCRIEISGVKYVYEDSDHFVTKVNTDFWLILPDFDWGNNRSLTAFDGSDTEADLPKNNAEDRFRLINYVKYHNWTKE